MDTFKAVCAAFLLLIAIGCGGGNSSGNPTPTPTPQSALSVCGREGTSCNSPTTVTVGASEQMVASATSGTLPALNWSVNGVQGGSAATGTISNSGLFTAPSSFPSGKDVTITATSQSNASISGSLAAIIVDNSLSQTAPVKMGTSGGNATDLVNNGTTITCCSGTLGSIIVRGSTFFVLSNNHVLDKSDTGTAGQAITQPGLIDSNCSPAMSVATLTQGAALKPTSISTTGACAGQPAPCGPAPSNVDAAIAQIVAGQVDTSGNILDLGGLSGNSIGALPPSATTASPATVLSSGEGVAKSGRRTGLTCSTLQSVITTVSVQYAGSCGGATAFTATFANQVIINGGNFSAPGDSGSLVVTSDTARPVGLLYGGNSTSSSANPIQDVISAFTNGSGTPSVVGGADHAVSCSAVANSSTFAAGQNFTALSAQEQQRASAARDKNASALMRDAAITSVTAGASEDSPGEAALVIEVSGATRSPIPATLDGVRTRVVAASVAAQMPVLRAQDFDHAIAVKENHVADLMAQRGIQGVGVGRSSDNPAEPAIVIYVVSGVAHPTIPATIEGIRTKIVAGDRFRAY